MPEKDSRDNGSQLVDVSRLAAELEQFAADRNWAQFHSPKNLVMALTGELGELTELFQWMTEAQSREACKDPATASKVEQELADVLMYLVAQALNTCAVLKSHFETTMLAVKMNVNGIDEPLESYNQLVKAGFEQLAPKTKPDPLKYYTESLGTVVTIEKMHLKLIALDGGW